MFKFGYINKEGCFGVDIIFRWNELLIIILGGIVDVWNKFCFNLFLKCKFWVDFKGKIERLIFKKYVILIVGIDCLLIFCWVFVERFWILFFIIC